MTLKEAEECVKNKYPKATCFYSAAGKGFFIHETRYFLSKLIGPAFAAQSRTAAWKEVAFLVHEGIEL